MKRNNSVRVSFPVRGDERDREGGLPEHFLQSFDFRSSDQVIATTRINEPVFHRALGNALDIESVSSQRCGGNLCPQASDLASESILGEMRRVQKDRRLTAAAVNAEKPCVNVVHALDV